MKNLRDPGYYADGAGLYLQVTESRAKSWIFRYTRGLNPTTGKPWQREMGLGSLTTYSLAEARERAREQRKVLDEGKDPIEVRNAQKAAVVLENARAMTFAECASAYIKAFRAGWKNDKHAEQWTSTIEAYANPVMGTLPVQAIDTAIVLKALRPIWETKTETASRLRGRIESILGWATVHKYRSGDNPARWRGHLDKLLPKPSKVKKVEHHDALPYEEIAEFLPKLRSEPGTAPRALELAILTATRTAEVIGAKAEEFELARAIWTIPAERMKAGKDHRVPLSPRAVEIVKAQLKAQPEDAEFIFPGRDSREPMSNMAMLQTLRRMRRDDLTVHGFRSTFKDWAADTTNYPNIVSEMALAHTIGDKTEEAYRRRDLFEKRRRLMLDWARFCNTPKARGKVIPIGRGKAARR